MPETQSPSKHEIREELESAVRAELLGPKDGPEEIVDERNVRRRYLVGLLAPKGQSALPEESDELAVGGIDDEDGKTEARPSKASVSMLPSSIGLTFAVAKGAEAIQITACWGWYERARIEDESYQRKDGGYYPVWQRIPIEGTSDPITLDAGDIPKWAPNPDQPDVYVQGRIRDRNEQWIITLFLVNGQQEPDIHKDSAWVFQPELVVRAPDGTPIFRKRPLPRDATDHEQRAMEMIYRKQVEFAVGHGVAVHAKPADEYADRAVELRTAVMPAHEVPDVVTPTADDIPALASLTLDMKALAKVPDGEFGENLMPLVGAYREWIAAQAERVENPTPDLEPYLDTARTATDNCEETLERIRAGIDLLDENSQAADAFRFANRAMYLQRIRTELAARVRQGEKNVSQNDVDVPKNRTWRVFQLAFILLNLPALTDVAHEDRTLPLDDAGDRTAIADLLWFPTGGGKTEAYLGVAAYTLGIRRLQGEVGGRSGHAGVAVLMRYTLRLLTLQQFQRAATLICACEVIRDKNPDKWGTEPFRIGLWVGQRSTPNWTKHADEAIKQAHGAARYRGGSTPHQLTNCPWCGKPIDEGRDIDVDEDRLRTFIYCSDVMGMCPFSRRQAQYEGIPVLTVDEEIYRRLPALLIATVDKFAQMPWNGRTAMLFGQVDGYCERHGYRSPEIEDSDYHQAKNGLGKAKTVEAGPLRPPDLIIQDELHLISGPLGTLVGLYETAIDFLASWEGDGTRVRPKVIASTATVRRAQSQVHSLYLRNVNIFPPHGLDVEDNFFSRQVEPSESHPGRRYLGICAPGIRHKTALIRTYVAFLAAGQYLFDKYGRDADPWMTLVGYFNSMRELGGMRRATEDSVSTRLRRMHQRGLAQRYIDSRDIQELTSRLSAADIPEVLDRLEVSFSTDDYEGKFPIEVLLATNMISVGVDVGRLGLMVVAAQPKTTAEYIQATSRVGRRHPGLVCTVYNWARPRDLSHYERFEQYHATFYQNVEALSVTPFSPRAVQRGLSGVLVGLARLHGLDLNANEAAGTIDDYDAVIQEVADQLAARAAHVAGNDAAELVRETLNNRIDEWRNRARNARSAKLGYKAGRDGVTVGLLRALDTNRWETFTCLNSLRDVEIPSNLILRDKGLNPKNDNDWRFPEEAVEQAEGVAE